MYLMLILFPKTQSFRQSQMQDRGKSLLKHPFVSKVTIMRVKFSAVVRVGTVVISDIRRAGTRLARCYIIGDAADN